MKGSDDDDDDEVITAGVYVCVCVWTEEGVCLFMTFKLRLHSTRGNFSGATRLLTTFQLLPQKLPHVSATCRATLHDG